MNTFSAYFELGLRHIADFDAYDHMLFILVLIAVYQIIDIKRIVILITAFTLGHSITLILATTGLIRVSSAWVEFLIPVTIFITAVINIVKGKAGKGNLFWAYFLAAFFGLIHGLGFSNYLQMLLSREGELFVPLVAFNLGIELGQLLIVGVILIVSVIAFQLFRFKQRDWILVISGAGVGIALILAKDAVFW